MSEEMNLVKKLRNPEVLDRISSIDWFGRSDVGPYVVELDPTAACDLACPGCISEDVIAEGGRFSNERLLQFPKEFQETGIQAVILIGGGEPLTHPRIGDFIVECQSRDIHVGLTSNGTLIDRYLQEIATGCSWVRVSMDAGSQGLFDKLRPAKSGRSVFDKVVQNMTNLAKVKTGVLGYSYLLQSPKDGEKVLENIDDMLRAAKLARDIGCDYFEVKPTYAWRENVPHALVVHEQSYLDRAREKVAQLDSLETDGFKIVHAINLKYSLEGVQALQIKEYHNCPSAQLRTLITPKGVYVCPYWRGKSRFKIGDVNMDEFSKVWNSSEKERVMNNLDPSRDCKFHCLRHDTNLTVLDLKAELERHGSPIHDQVSDRSSYDRFI